MFICSEQMSLESTAGSQVMLFKEAVINSRFSVKLLGSNSGGNMVSQPCISESRVDPLD